MLQELAFKADSAMRAALGRHACEDRGPGPRQAARRAAAAFLVAAALAQAASAPAAADEVETARFTVTDRVLHADMQPFGFSASRYGNASVAESFEPEHFISRYTAKQDAPDRVYAHRLAINLFNTVRSGAFDGADVTVYRVENGALRVVRVDRVAEGGYHASGWLDETRKNRVIPADVTEYALHWPVWERRGALNHFTVRAVSPDGKLSPPANAVRVSTPEEIEKGKPPARPLEKLRILGGKKGGPEAPGNLRVVRGADGGQVLTWDPVPGAAGYRIYRADLPPEEHRGFYFELEKGTDAEPIRKGDMIFLRKPFYRYLPEKVVANNKHGTGAARRLFRHSGVRSPSEGSPLGHTWEKLPHEPDTPVTEPGETFLRFDIQAGGTARLWGFLPRGTSRGMAVMRPEDNYTASMWIRGERPGTVEVRIDPIEGASGKIPVPNKEIAFDTEWRQISFQFSNPEIDLSRRRRSMLFIFDGENRVDIDNFRVYRTDTPFYGLGAEAERRVHEAGMGFFRAHSLATTRRISYDLRKVTDVPGVANLRSIPLVLRTVDRLGIDPWLQIEPHLMPQEWTDLVEYLGAPYDPAVHEPADRPWAARRRAQGREAPWTDAFGKIYLEIGNETWNRIFYPATFPVMQDGDRRVGQARVYGMFMQYVIERMRASPYWEASGLEDKLVLVIGGWHGQPYGRKAAEHAPRSDVLAISAYNGGWDVGEGPVTETPHGFSTVLNDVNQLARPRAMIHVEEAAELNPGRARPLGLGAYEAGPGYVLNGLNKRRVTREQQAVQERVMKSVAAGAATLDAFLARASIGYSLQAFFQFRPGNLWSSHTRWYDGGHAYPSWDWIGLMNRVGLGDMQECRADSVPTIDLEKYRLRVAVEDAPLVGCYVTRADDRLTLVLISRRVPDYPQAGDDGRTRVEVTLPIAGAGRVTRHRSSAGYAATNVDEQEARILTDEHARNWQGPVFTLPDLPPGEPMVFVFDDVTG